ncbi:hypothetical protein N0V83_007709 [Neocucurbitaria cava]|uniref:Uncharacterized protein n=1 Tax=Neocucurbitaria cava TaxID=798079 RepID=A0A9W8Y3S9_9PLEO|nr:hypothetical protein N0V83_007709 [Neocucurbitaria cava]
MSDFFDSSFDQVDQELFGDSVNLNLHHAFDMTGMADLEPAHESGPGDNIMHTTEGANHYDGGANANITLEELNRYDEIHGIEWAMFTAGEPTEDILPDPAITPSANEDQVAQAFDDLFTWPTQATFSDPVVAPSVNQDFSGLVIVPSVNQDHVTQTSNDLIDLPTPTNLPDPAGAPSVNEDSIAKDPNDLCQQPTQAIIPGAVFDQFVDEDFTAILSDPAAAHYVNQNHAHENLHDDLRERSTQAILPGAVIADRVDDDYTTDDPDDIFKWPAQVIHSHPAAAPSINPAHVDEDLPDDIFELPTAGTMETSSSIQAPHLATPPPSDEPETPQSDPRLEAMAAENARMKAILEENARLKALLAAQTPAPFPVQTAAPPKTPPKKVTAPKTPKTTPRKRSAKVPNSRTPIQKKPTETPSALTGAALSLALEKGPTEAMWGPGNAALPALPVATSSPAAKPKRARAPRATKKSKAAAPAAPAAPVAPPAPTSPAVEMSMQELFDAQFLALSLRDKARLLVYLMQGIDPRTGEKVAMAGGLLAPVLEKIASSPAGGGSTQDSDAYAMLRQVTEALAAGYGATRQQEALERADALQAAGRRR